MSLGASVEMKAAGLLTESDGQAASLTGEPQMLNTMKWVVAGAVLLGLAACGHTTEQRAATGAAAGLVIAGPIGAAVGAGAGVVVSRAQGRR